MYACIIAHETNSFRGAVPAKRKYWWERTKHLDGFLLMKVLGSYISWDKIVEFYMYTDIYAYTHILIEQSFVYVCTSECMSDNSLHILNCRNPSISFLWLSVLCFRILFVRLILRPENTILKWFSNLLSFQEKYILLPYNFFFNFSQQQQRLNRKWSRQEMDRKISFYITKGLLGNRWKSVVFLKYMTASRL